MRMWMLNRWHAAGVHLTISILIGGALLGAMMLVWYPPPLFQASGAAQLTITIMLVNVATGPLLTLIVFKPGKPSLRFDLAVVVALQLATFGYGLHVVTQSRPAYLVVTPHRAVIVHANELYFVPKPSPVYRNAPWSGPKIVFAEAPDDPEQRSALLFEVIDGLPDAEFRPGLYSPIETASDQFWTSGETVKQLLETGRLDAKSTRLWLHRRGHSVDGLRAVPLITRGAGLILVIDSNHRVVVGPLSLASPN